MSFEVSAIHIFNRKRDLKSKRRFRSTMPHATLTSKRSTPSLSFTSLTISPPHLAANCPVRFQLGRSQTKIARPCFLLRTDPTGDNCGHNHISASMQRFSYKRITKVSCFRARWRIILIFLAKRS